MSLRTLLSGNWADRLGLLVSALCGLHCAATPLLVLALPSFALLPHDENLHVGLAAAIPLISVAAFTPGYRHHRDGRVLAYLLSGISLITLAAINPSEALNLVCASVVTLSGSILIVSAHVRNRRLCASCSH